MLERRPGVEPGACAGPRGAPVTKRGIRNVDKNSRQSSRVSYLWAPPGPRAAVWEGLVRGMQGGKSKEDSEQATALTSTTVRMKPFHISRDSRLSAWGGKQKEVASVALSPLKRGMRMRNGSCFQG